MAISVVVHALEMAQEAVIRVVAVDDGPAVPAVMSLSQCCDHRLTDGARAAAFLKNVVDAIGKPLELLPL